MKPLIMLICFAVILLQLGVTKVCQHNEVQLGNECCPPCGSGQRVTKVCTDYTSVTCTPCPNGTYVSGLYNCTDCTQCNVTQVMIRNCTSTNNTVCAPKNHTYFPTPGVQHHKQRQQNHTAHITVKQRKSGRHTLAWLSLFIFLVGIILLILYLIAAYRSERCQQCCSIGKIFYRTL
ncbi:membrane glycoprotein UL144 [Human betaherpesvirus 5]|uniref:Membrane glycoprotein UL144 n=1 Tax=Human cytomegalovirus TaxID=10359 RepID=A0A0G2TZ34_HCMV|nr:membrane glycoprotein UL144 [Human betaherpesvirus 5]